MTHPPIFADQSFDAALSHARSSSRLLLVDATASWCGPCQMMDRTTWVHPRVVEALGRTALVIQVDVDAQPEVSQRLGIQAMPTVIAFRDGAELDRVVGMQKPEELLQWVDALSRGETSLQRARAAAAANPTAVKGRMSLAGMLLERGALDEALGEYLWLWQHMLEHEPSMAGVRGSYLVRSLHQLVAQHPPARAAFAELRDALAPKTDEPPTRDGFGDWVSLNEVLGEGDAILRWFDAAHPHVKRDDAFAEAIAFDIATVLNDAGRWADLASLYPKPLATLAEGAAHVAEVTGSLPPDFPPERVERLRRNAIASQRETAAMLVRALLAAGRTEEAAAVRDEAQRVDPSPEMKAAVVSATAQA